MFSSLSTIADRNFVIAFLLPTLIGCLCLLALFGDVPAIAALAKNIGDLDKLSALTGLLVGLWSVALLLQQLNLTLYRVLEGYLPPFSLPRFKLRQRQLDAYDAARAAVTKLYQDSLADSALDDAYNLALHEFYRRFPADRDLVLPTGLGNAIRAFETYSDRIYGVDAIPGWPRLAGVIPDSYAKGLDAARAEVDFFVNLTFVAAFIAVLALLHGVAGLGFLWRLDWSAADSPAIFFSAAIVAAAAAWAMYCGALERAQGWGELVCSAFDLYLPALAKQLGYDLPATPDERRNFWDAMTSQWLYGKAAADPADWKSALPAEPDPDDF